MARLEHVGIVEQEGPSAGGRINVPLSENWVVFLSPRPGDGHKEAIEKYEAYLYYVHEGTGARTWAADINPTGTKGTWEPTIPDDGFGRGPRGGWRFEFKDLTFILGGFYHCEVEFRMPERMSTEDARGECMLLERSRSIGIRILPPPLQSNGHGPSANGERH
ncbi:hypothetical protein GE09DRAFT_1119744 [Coniochaeta sp. 2T2.1]|nr:hypothetical protein GE09DRAFT_1119744 [Coniochaeta sp. 2T2.1]